MGYNSKQPGSAVFAEYLAVNIAYFLQRDHILDRLDAIGHDVFPRFTGIFQIVQVGADGAGVAFPFDGGKALELFLFHLFVDLEGRDRLFLLCYVLVDADHDLFAMVYLLLETISGIGDLELRVPLFNRRDHAAHVVDLGDVLPRLFLHLVGQGLNEVGAGERVDRVGDACFLGENLLGAQRDLDGVLGGEGQHLVEGIGMQRLRAAQHPGQRLDRRTDDIVVRLLGGKRAPRRLRVEAQPPGTRVFGMKAFLHHVGPYPPRRPHLAYLLEKVDVRVEKEGEAGGEGIDIQTLALNNVFDVLDAVAERKGQLLHGGRSRFPDMVAADADRVPFRDVFRAEFHRVADDPDGWLRRAHEGLLGDELLEHVVLNRSPDPGKRHPSFVRGGAVHRPQHRGGGVDGHRGRYLVQRNFVHEGQKVVEGVYCNAAPAAFAAGLGRVGVVAHQCREIKGRAQPRLPF